MLLKKYTVVIKLSNQLSKFDQTDALVKKICFFYEIRFIRLYFKSSESFFNAMDSYHSLRIMKILITVKGKNGKEIGGSRSKALQLIT